MRIEEIILGLKVASPSVCFFLYFLTGCIMCGMYSFNNPDTFISERDPMKYCWAMPFHEPNFEITTDGHNPPQKDATNVTQNFLTWFTWGFYFNCAMLMSTCCAYAGMSILLAANRSEFLMYGTCYF